MKHDEFAKEHLRKVQIEDDVVVYRQAQQATHNAELRLGLHAAAVKPPGASVLVVSACIFTFSI